MKVKAILVFIAVMVLLSTSVAASETVNNTYYVFDDVEGTYVLDESGNLESVPEVAPLADISDNYGVGTTNVQIFAGVASKLPFGVNYVYWRESQYEYCMAYGPQLVLSGTTFNSSGAVAIVTYTTATSSQRQATYRLSSENNFSLPAGNYLVWSNLGHYPRLTDGGDMYAQVTAFALIGACAFYLLTRIMRRCFGR